MIEITDKNEVVLNFKGDTAPIAMSSYEEPSEVKNALGFVAIAPGRAGRTVCIKRSVAKFLPIYFLFNDTRSIDVIIERLNEIKESMTDAQVDSSGKPNSD